MKYPHVNNCLKYSRNSDGSVTAVDIFTDQEYEMDPSIARLLQKLDGRNPLSRYVALEPDECCEVEDELLEMGLLRKGRVEIDFPMVRVALWMADGASQKQWESFSSMDPQGRLFPLYARSSCGNSGSRHGLLGRGIL